MILKDYTSCIMTFNCSQGHINIVKSHINTVKYPVLSVMQVRNVLIDSVNHNFNGQVEPSNDVNNVNACLMYKTQTQTLCSLVMQAIYSAVVHRNMHVPTR